VRVISVSLPEDTVDELDRRAEQDGYSGRSELVRAALGPFLDQARDEEARKGPATATLVLAYDEEISDLVNRRRHDHAEPITTMVHGHTDDHRCLEVLVLEGGSDEIRSLADDLRGRPGMNQVELAWLD
jgi:CopG family nickel-responsive transcriptional regulator